MCGIAGVVCLGGAEGLSDDVRRMTGALRHRGPDDEGIYVDAAAGVALGHRRLSIIDLSASGHQPMADRSGRYVVSYNGELYNFVELREELEASGSTFEGTSDTEVLVEGIARWGLERTLARSNGMFAIALWDRETRTLHLARDRIGKKPLYYGWMGRKFVFASELSAIRALPDCAPSVDRDALACFLRFNATPGTRSILLGIFKLEPGGIRTLVTPSAHAGDRPSLHRFWSAAHARIAGLEAPLEGSAEEAVDALESLVHSAVGLRMVSDVPLGSFLSGGIDSSLVTAVMQRHSAKPVRTFSIGFDVPGFDESHHARAVAQHLGTDHTELRVRPDDAMEVIGQLPTIYDEPFADVSQIPTYIVSRLARQHVTVCLSGDGGDELFAGYDRYAYVDRLYARIGRLPARARRPVARALRALALASSNGPRRVASQADRLRLVERLLSSESGADFYRSALAVWREERPVVLGTNPDPARVVGLEPSPPLLRGDMIELASYVDTVGYLPDDILVKVDRASMAVSLEARAPLLDYRIVEHSFRTPTAWKTRDARPKWPLIELVQRYVPRELIDRPKMGFGVPIHEWLRGPLRDWADDLLEPATLRRQGYLDAELVSRRWREHREGTRNRAPDIWAVLMFQSWLARDRRPG
ncbi:MAG: asparagine synthase (glutamine-hydrolyzing) [Sandaracinaceae bacterium]